MPWKCRNLYGRLLFLLLLLLLSLLLFKRGRQCKAKRERERVMFSMCFLCCAWKNVTLIFVPVSAGRKLLVGDGADKGRSLHLVNVYGADYRGARHT